MDGWDKGGHGITQHDDPGSYTDHIRPNNLEKNPKGAATACLSIDKAISRVKEVKEISYLYSCYVWLGRV